MSVTVKQRFIHMTARKLRLVAHTVRGQSTDSALAMLAVMPRAAAEPLLHAVKSAVSAAQKQQPNDSFVIKSLYIDEGPALKRRILRSRGRSSRMEHRMSHITLEIDTLTQPKTKALTQRVSSVKKETR
jgi:large subunit ribosomal protein L22